MQADHDPSATAGMAVRGAAIPHCRRGIKRSTPGSLSCRRSGVDA